MLPVTVPDTVADVCGAYTVIGDTGLVIARAGAGVELCVIGGIGVVEISVVPYKSERLATNKFVMFAVRTTF